MAAPTGSIVNQHSDTFEEVINQSIGLFMPQKDYVWRNLVTTSQGVHPADDIGRDFKVLKAYQGSYAGVIEPGGPTDDFTIYGDAQNTNLGSRVFRQGLATTWPSARGGANARRKRLGVPMRSMLTNLMWTMGELQAEALPALIGEIIQPKLEGHAEYLSHMMCNYWYLSQNSYYALHDLGDTSVDLTYEQSTGSGDYDTMIIDTKDSNYAIDRVAIGMRLNFYTSNGATKARTASGASVFIVTYLDETTGIYKVQAEDGSALASSAAASGGTITDGTNVFGSSTTFDDGIVVFANSKGTSTTPFSASPYFTGIPGINSWLKCGTGGNDNYLLGAERDTSNSIDVTKDFGEMKSMKYSLDSQPLTEHVMRMLCRRFHAAKAKYGHDIDCFIASDGVWTAYEETRIGRERTDRTNRRPNLRSQGFDGGGDADQGLFSFEMDGRTYQGYTSSFIESGTVYGIKKGGNNWSRIVPPDPRGAKKNDKVPSFIPFRFAGPIVNNGQVAMPILAVGDDGMTLMTEGVQTPGMVRMSLIPKQSSMLKLTNVAESRLYGDVS